MAFAVEDDILGFEVAIDYAVAVETLKGQDYLRCVETGSLFSEFGLLAQMEEKLTTVKEVNHEVQSLWGLEGVMQLDNERVINSFQNHAFNYKKVQISQPHPVSSTIPVSQQ